MAKVAAIVLAAGAAARFRAAGGAEASKLVADLGGKPLLRHPVEAALASRARPVIVVTGHEQARIRQALDGLAVRFTHNADYALGLASSLKAGIAATPEDSAGALILLGDMPGVTPALIDRLIDAFSAQPEKLAIAPSAQGRRGNPALLSRALFARIAGLEGDEGARGLLARLPAAEILEVETKGDAATLDVDTPQALDKGARVVREVGRSLRSEWLLAE